MAERVNESQIRYIIDYMTKNKNVLRVICAGPKSENVLRIKWTQITKALNSLGPPVKTVLQWQKVWRYLRNISIMKIIRNRSRVATKKISSLIPQSMISGIRCQDTVSTVGKRPFSLSNRSGTTNFYLPVSHTVQTNGQEMSCESRSSHSPAFSLDRRNKRAVEKIKKSPRLSSLRKENKPVFKKATNPLQSISFSLNTLPEYL